MPGNTGILHNRPMKILIRILASLCCLASFQSGAQTYSKNDLAPKAKILVRFMEKNHYQPHSWDDSMSARLYDRWIEILDDDHLIFFKSDMEQFGNYRLKLDDEINSGNMEFFDKSVAVYFQRIKQLDSIVHVALKSAFNFTKEEFTGEKIKSNPIDANEMSARWQKYMKARVLSGIMDEYADSVSTLPATGFPKNFSSVEIRARRKLELRLNRFTSELKRPFNEFEKEFGDAFLDAMAWCYDPHSNYMNADQKKAFASETSAAAFSAGMKVERNENGEIYILSLEPGGPAWRSGELHAGDIIEAIAVGSTESKDVAGLDADEVDKILQNVNDKPLQLTIRNGSATKKVVISKEKITDDESIVKSFLLNGKKKIGYIELPGFYTSENEGVTNVNDIDLNGCANDVAKEIVKLKEDKIDGLILDLRFNGGGSMWESMQLAGIFIDYGSVASLKDKAGKVVFLKDPNRGTVYTGPLLVLVNGQSASASELTAACLQDYNRALIVGGTTYGKGTSQVVLPMDTALDLSGQKNYTLQKDFVKITEGKFYRVNGSTTQFTGVIPDIFLPEPGFDEREEKNASALRPDESRKAMFQQLPELPKERLKNLSAVRVSLDSFFVRINRLNQIARGEHDFGKIPLKWESFLKNYRERKLMEDGKPEPVSNRTKKISAENNSFDKQKLIFASDLAREMNKDRLEEKEDDPYVIEACQIIFDWIN